MIEIIINGQVHHVAERTTLASLVEKLDLSPRIVAIEVNQQLVPRADHARRHLEKGDRLEIVSLTGGG
jgi:sulfur carrier protein